MPMTANSAASPDSTAKPPAALRVTLAYRGREIRLVASRRVAMIAPPSAGPAPDASASGYWCELRDASGNRAYHRVLSNPMPASIEVFSERPGATMTRVPREEMQGEFDVVVPDLPQARTFAFFGPPGRAEEGAPAEELFRVDVDELRKAGGRGSPAGPDTSRGNAAR